MFEVLQQILVWLARQVSCINISNLGSCQFCNAMPLKQQKSHRRPRDQVANCPTIIPSQRVHSGRYYKYADIDYTVCYIRMAMSYNKFEMVLDLIMLEKI